MMTAYVTIKKFKSNFNNN